MRIWNRISIAPAAAVLLMAASPVGGAEACKDDCDRWGVQGSAEYLFWNVRQDDLDYAFDSDGSSSLGDVHVVEPNYDHGFRVGVAATRGATSFGLGYTMFSSDADDSITRDEGVGGTLIIDDFTNLSQAVDSADAEWDIDYHAVDANIEQRIAISERLEGRVIVGFKYASIDQDYDVVYEDDGSFDRVSQENELDGFGANLGLGAAFQLFDRVSLTGSFVYSPMVALIDRNFSYDASSTADLDDDRTKVVNVIDAKAGLDVALFEFGQRGRAHLGLGYEWQTWLNHPALLKHTSESGEETLDRNTSDLTFDGLFVRLGVAF